VIFHHSWMYLDESENYYSTLKRLTIQSQFANDATGRVVCTELTACCASTKRVPPARFVSLETSSLAAGPMDARYGTDDESGLNGSAARWDVQCRPHWSWAQSLTSAWVRWLHPTDLGQSADGHSVRNWPVVKTALGVKLDADRRTDGEADQLTTSSHWPVNGQWLLRSYIGCMARPGRAPVNEYAVPCSDQSTSKPAEQFPIVSISFVCTQVWHLLPVIR